MVAGSSSRGLARKLAWSSWLWSHWRNLSLGLVKCFAAAAAEAGIEAVGAVERAVGPFGRRTRCCPSGRICVAWRRLHFRFGGDG